MHSMLKAVLISEVVHKNTRRDLMTSMVKVQKQAFTSRLAEIHHIRKHKRNTNSTTSIAKVVTVMPHTCHTHTQLLNTKRQNTTNFLNLTIAL